MTDYRNLFIAEPWSRSEKNHLWGY